MHWSLHRTTNDLLTSINRLLMLYSFKTRLMSLWQKPLNVLWNYMKLCKGCQKICTGGQWLKNWTQSLLIPVPEKGNTRLSEPHEDQPDQSKVMLRVILNMLKARQNRSWRRNIQVSDHRAGELLNIYSI